MLVENRENGSLEELDLNGREDNISMNVTETGCGLDSTVSVQSPMATCCEHGDEAGSVGQKMRLLTFQEDLVSVLNTWT
jgi:hypothetical protein